MAPEELFFKHKAAHKEMCVILMTTDPKSTRSAGGHGCRVWCSIHGRTLASLVHSTAIPSADALPELRSIQGLLI